MGMNFHSCCHRCKQKIHHFRNEENKGLAPFYQLHQPCIEKDPTNVETRCDYWGQDETFISDDSYDEVTLNLWIND